MAIPFVRNFEFEYGRCDPLSPLVQRVIADNPGPFTYTGTGVYIIGNESVAVIDPGPDTPNHRDLKAAKCGLRRAMIYHLCQMLKCATAMSSKATAGR